MQSRNYCFAVKSLLGKDSKDAYKEFKDFFAFLKRSGMKAYQHQNLDLLSMIRKSTYIFSDKIAVELLC
jgi:hypothetical protein